MEKVKTFRTKLQVGTAGEVEDGVEGVPFDDQRRRMDGGDR